MVDLIDGRVVWCALLPFNGLSVRDRGGAQQFVDLLTSGLFAMTPPPGTRPAPPPVQPAAPAVTPSAAAPPSGPRAPEPNQS